jgi:hypothetical protein
MKQGNEPALASGPEAIARARREITAIEGAIRAIRPRKGCAAGWLISRVN